MEYYGSENWKLLRRSKIAKKRYCSICQSKTDLGIHILIYREPYTYNTTDLRVMCRDCHLKALVIEKIPNLYLNENHNSRFMTLKNALNGRLRKKSKPIERPETVPLFTIDV